VIPGTSKGRADNKKKQTRVDVADLGSSLKSTSGGLPRTVCWAFSFGTGKSERKQKKERNSFRQTAEKRQLKCYWKAHPSDFVANTSLTRLFEKGGGNNKKTIEETLDFNKGFQK